MKVVIIGCGRLGSDLAYRLYQRGHEVSVIDLQPASFNNLPADFQGRLNEGDALNQDVLYRSGIQSADAVAVMTNVDSLNAVLGHLARSEYNITNVVVRNYDPSARPLLESFGLQFVSATHWGAQRAEEMLSHNDVRSVFSAGNGEVEVYEFIVPESWNGKSLRALIPENIARPVSLTRAGRAVLPNIDDVLEESDVIDVAATFDGAEEIRNRLGVKKQEEV